MKKLIPILLTAAILVSLCAGITVNAATQSISLDGSTQYYTIDPVSTAVPDGNYRSATCYITVKASNAITWDFESSTGTLYIYGSGKMPNYDLSSAGSAPWASYCRSVKKVVIGSGITSIGEHAFLGMVDFDLVIPASVTQINETFAPGDMGLPVVKNVYTPSLKAWLGISFPKKTCCPLVRDDCTLYVDNSPLTALTVPSDVYAIKDYAFYSYKKLTSISVPGSVTRIGAYAFQNCMEVSSIKLSEGLQTIGDDAFQFCNKVKKVTIPSSVTTVGVGAFSFIGALQSVTVFSRNCTLGENKYTLGTPGVTTIYGYQNSTAQSYASTYGYSFVKLEEPSISLNKTELLLEIDKGYHLIATVSPKDAEVTWKSSDPSVVSVDNNGWVKALADSGTATITAYANGASASCVVTCTPYIYIYIHEDSYAVAIGESMQIDYSVTPRDAALNWTSSAPSVVSVSSSGKITGKSKGTATITASYMGKQDTCVVTCYDKNDVVTGTSGKITWTLDMKTGVLTLTGTGTIESEFLSEYADKITQIIICEGITGMDDYAFEDCPNLVSVSLPEGLTSIGNRAFSWCEKLKQINIPSTVTYIGSNAFDQTLVGEHVGDLIYIGDWLVDAFRASGNVVIREGTKAIAAMAFWQNNMTSLTLPRSLQTICYRALDDCEELTKLVILNKDFNMFSALIDIPTGTKLTVYGFAGSTAEEFAKKQGNRFVAIHCGDAISGVSGHEYDHGVCVYCGAKDPDYIPLCDDYTDIKSGAWYYNAVEFVLSRKIMGSTKTDALVFEPNTVCTRSMVVSILYRLAGSPKSAYIAQFPDVADNQWYTDAVIWAYENGIVSGYDNGKFGPNDKVTREQMAVILMSYTQIVLGKNTSARANIANFPDEYKSTWSRDAVRWAVAEGLLSGKAQNGTNYLDPQGNATRAEVAALLSNFIQKIVEAE